VKHWLLLDQ
jgi:hypothetical protein